jgi:hypothetical protein
MPALAGLRIFTVGGTSYAWEDVVAAGCLWGDWPALEARVRDGLACLARLDELDEDDEGGLDEDEVEAAAAEFRYARDLVAAADLEAWLERRGLTVDGWLDYVRRSLLRERWAGELEAIRDAYEIDDDDVAGALACETICGGRAGELAARLAARAAIHARDEAAGGGAVPPGEAERLVAEVSGSLLARALPGLTPATRRQRLRAVARLEAAWQRFAAGVASPAALGALVAAHRLEWIRVRAQMAVAADEDVARELALCVRVDQRALAEVAGEAGLDARAAELWVEELDEPLRDALVAATPGAVLGPLAVKEGFAVLVVDDKRLPSADDPAVRARAERALLARTVDREVADRVTWHESL